ncbi:uncharacterized protein LOC110276847 [Arachis duranensis]|uniref:Uncharacterized protein LOC110276847 n=1 Tax=Arachis duranensis TaxID=130453 RepID=A0A6P5MY18_ARADU|nr:uncharacterized protein LOC110276847 [Arachis duranensis]
MAPYEALYGRRCQSPLCWYGPEDKGYLGPELVRQTTEDIKRIRGRRRTAQSRQKSYADQRRKPLEFQEGDHVFLKITPTTGVGRALKVRKLSPRYLGPFQILRRIGKSAYQLALPPNLTRLHNVFHVSQLRKYQHDPSHVLQQEDVTLKDDLTFELPAIEIVDRSMKQPRSKTIQLVKVAWGSGNSRDYTWEKEADMRQKFLNLFTGNNHGEDLLFSPTIGNFSKTPKLFKTTLTDQVQTWNLGTNSFLTGVIM